jgi:predicted small integral membrane protein
MNKSASTTRGASPEARLFRAYWDDGLIDLLFGLGAIAVGLLWLADLVVFGAIVPVFVALAWRPLRSAIVEPRTGWMEFSRARTESNRQKLLASVLIGVGLLGLVVVGAVWVNADGGLTPSDLAAAIPAVLVGIMAALLGLGLQLGRFIVYGLAFALCGGLVAIAGGDPGLGILAGGVVTAIAGAWLLARFLRATSPIDAA